MRGITHLGGTILGTNNRGNPLAIRVVENGAGALRGRLRPGGRRTSGGCGFDGLIAIGGDGSLKIASGLAKKGIPIIGVPKTIDNDLAATVRHLRLRHRGGHRHRRHRQAALHRREPRPRDGGRGHGPLLRLDRALTPGIAGGADVILIPEIPFSIDKVCEKIMDRERRGRHFSIVVCAEGAQRRWAASMTTVGRRRPAARRGWAASRRRWPLEIEKRTGKETRSLVLGHLQRGGQPTAFDRLLALRFGAAAVRLAEEGRWGTMVAFDPPEMTAVPLEAAVASLKTVPLDGDTVRTARELGISFGTRAPGTAKAVPPNCANSAGSTRPRPGGGDADGQSPAGAFPRGVGLPVDVVAVALVENPLFPGVSGAAAPRRWGRAWCSRPAASR